VEVCLFVLFERKENCWGAFKGFMGEILLAGPKFFGPAFMVPLKKSKLFQIRGQ